MTQARQHPKKSRVDAVEPETGGPASGSIRPTVSEGKVVENFRLLDVTGAWVLLGLPGGEVLSWSDEFLALTGRPKRTFTKGLAARDLFRDPPGAVQGCEQFLQEAAQGKPVTPHEVLLDTASGPRRHVCGCLVVAARGRRPAAVLCQLYPPPEPPGSGRARRMRLTGRQLEILTLIVEGWATDDIALELGLRPHTVRNHVRGLLRRLGVGTRLEAAVMAVRRGLV